MTRMELKDILTTTMAAVGAVLGIFNAWRAWSSDRIRVRVSISNVIAFPGGERAIGIEVVNLSSFPLTITNLGFERLDSSSHLQITSPIFTGADQRLPFRLESRTAFTVLQPSAAGEIPIELKNVGRAYVSTACGHRALSKRAVGRHLV